jgi:hypothetical protein
MDIDLADGSDYIDPETGTNGSVIAWLDSGSYSISGSSQQYIWSIDTTIDVVSADSVAILGYASYILYAVSAPADTNLCVITGVVRRNDQTLVKNAKVEIKPPQEYKNICDSSFIVSPEIMTTWTGPWNGYSDGYFADTVLKCNCLPDTTAVYEISISIGSKTLKTIEVNIPRDSGTYNVTAFSE